MKSKSLKTLLTILLLSAFSLTLSQNVLIVEAHKSLPQTGSYVPLTIYIQKSDLIEKTGITIYDVNRTTIGLANTGQGQNNNVYLPANPVRPHLVTPAPARPNGLTIEASPVIHGSKGISKTLKFHLFGDSASVNLDGYASEVFNVIPTRFQNVFLLENATRTQSYKIHFSGYGLGSRVGVEINGLVSGDASGYISQSY